MELDQLWKSGGISFENKSFEASFDEQEWMNMQSQI